MNQSGRMEKVREALAFEAFTVMDEEQWIVDAALAEVEEWEARLTAVAQAWFDFDQEALDTLLGPYREEEA